MSESFVLTVEKMKRCKETIIQLMEITKGDIIVTDVQVKRTILHRSQREIRKFLFIYLCFLHTDDAPSQSSSLIIYFVAFCVFQEFAEFKFHASRLSGFDSISDNTCNFHVTSL